MTMKLNRVACIKLNTEEIRQGLEKVGFTLADWSTVSGDYIIISSCYRVYATLSKDESFSNPYFTNPIDCDTNVKLFLALAALRDDSDKHQLFICVKSCLGNNAGDVEICAVEHLDNPNYRKLSAMEIIEYFTKNNE